MSGTIGSLWNTINHIYVIQDLFLGETSKT